MMRKLLTTVVAGAFVLAVAPWATCADIVGTVFDTQGAAVQGVQVRVKDSAGKILASVQPNMDGRYQVTGLAPGRYEYLLDPLRTNFKAGSGTSYLNAQGLTIDWKVSTTNAAVALASEGTGSKYAAGDPFGMSNKTFAAVAVGGLFLITGGVVGGLAAGGEFNGPAASPAL
jgi:hypothetical protein